MHLCGGWHVILDDCVLANNTTGSVGGAIDADYLVVLDVNRCTITGNQAVFGGGINCGSDAPFAVTLNVSQSTISDNHANNIGNFPRTGNVGGIGVVNGCEATIANSTVSGNTASGFGSLQGIGGGIGVLGETTDSHLTLVNVTVSNNSATFGGGVAAFVLAGPGFGTEARFENTIVADNHDLGGARSCTTGGTPAILTSLGHNIEDRALCNFTAAGDQINTDAMLGVLGDNGGTTWTHALLVGSPAIDAGDGMTCLLPPVGGVDQRGVERPQGVGCDVGAFELQ